MTDLLIETQLLIDRITAKTSGFTTVAAMDDYPNGGNFEIDVLPACLIGDSGDIFKSQSRQDGSYLKDPFVFVSVIVERKTGAYNQAKTLLNAVKTAVLFDELDISQWQPDGLEYPFTLTDHRPPALYFDTYVMRNLIFTSQQRL